MSEEIKMDQDHLQFLESLDKVNRAIQGTSDLQQMMRDVLDAVMSIFDCDRIFLLYPCDPEAFSWSSPMERTKVEYPGVHALGLEMPMDAEVAETFRVLLDSDGPVDFGPESEHPLPARVAERFQIKSFVGMAIYPKSGKPWEFGIQQCSHARVWTSNEKQLLGVIGQRIADALSVLLSYQELLEKRTFVDNIVENIPNMIFVKDAQDLRFVRFNKAGEQLLGYSRQELLGKNDYDFFPKEEADFFWAKDHEVLDLKKPVDIPEETIQTRLKGERILHTQKVPILNEAGHPVYLLGISQDITEHKKAEDLWRQAEHEKRIQSQIADVFLTVPDEEMFGEVLAIVLQALKSKFGLFGFVETNGDLVIPSMTREIWDTCQVPDKSHVFPRSTWGASCWGRAIREKKALLSDGPFQVPAGHVPIRHFLTAPIIFGDVTIGLISVANNERGYGEEDKGFLENITNYISPILNARLQRDRQEKERARMEMELRQSNDLLRALIEAAPVAIMGLDLDGRVHTVWNPAAERMTGWSAQEVMGQFLPTVPEEKREEFRRFRELIRAGKNLDGVEVHRQRRDGTPIDYSIYASPLYDSEGRVNGNICVLVDITERRRGAMINAARLHLMEFAVTHSLDELLEEALNEAEKVTESRIGFFHFVGDDQQSLTLQNWSTRTKTQACGIQGKGMHYSIAEAGVWTECVQQRKPVVHNDYKTLTQRKGTPEGHAEVVRELVVPVLRGGKIKAIMGVGNKPADYSEMDVEALSRLADLVWEITERKQVEESVRKLSQAIEQSPVSIVITDVEGRIEFVNAKFSQITGYSNAEVLGQHIRILKSNETPVELYRQLWTTITSGGVWQGEFHNRKKNGELFWENATIAPVRDVNNVISHYVAVKEDITGRKKLEEQLRQSQKLEAAGQLAGGVAHDFNNMLGVIIGYAQMTLQKVALHDPVRKNLEEILKAGLRSSDITRQLLAFARKQTIEPKILDLNDMVEGMLKMLRRLIGENIDLVWLPGANVWPVKMDPSQIDQILVNLCVNARDSIAGIGKITLETQTVDFNDAYCADHEGFLPGEYVMLAVSDNGSGMDKRTKDKIFEPFFTTKGLGKGTGLGLATVYGIVKQNAGFINVYSEPGYGSIFKIYLPRHVVKIEPVNRESPLALSVGGHETILLVEDESAVLDVVKLMLEGLGYIVLSASTPGEALRLASENSGDINLLITDLVMPEMTGRDLAKHLTSLYPELKCLFMSGYTRDIIAHQGILDEGVNFIQKPFSKQELAAKVREVLDSK
jgi:PAS domain S-box-containing protein